MKRRGAALAWLLFVWLALTGNVSLLNVAAGATVSLFLLSVFRPDRATPAVGTCRPLHAAHVIGFFAVKLVKANIQVALAVIWPERVRDKRGIIAVPMVAASEMTATLLAHAVSLTPGTFILEMRHDPPTMYVHVLQLGAVRAARLEILDLERRIVRAFGPSGAVGRADELIARVAAESEE